MAKPKKEKEKPSPVPQKTSRPFRFPEGKRLYQLIIFTFAFLLYSNSIFNDYNMDDELVTKNQRITSKGWDIVKPNFNVFSNPQFSDSSVGLKIKYFLPAVFRMPYYEDKSGYKYEYRPIVQASFAIEHALFAKKEMVRGEEVENDSPLAGHFINVLLYALTCLIFFTVIIKLLPQYNLIFPFVIALLFVAHPIHTEVVASIKNRDEILSLLFGLLSLYAAMQYVLKNKFVYLLMVPVLFWLGILSKPTTITFALLIPLSLLMLTNVSYWRLVAITALLAIPSVFYARLFLLTQQAALAGALLVAVTLLFIFKNGLPHITFPRFSFEGLFKPDKTSEITDNPQIDLLKNPLQLAGVIILTVFAVGLLLWGFDIHNSILIFLPIVLFSLAYFLASYQLKALLITPLTILVLLALVKFHIKPSLLEFCLIVFLTPIVFDNNRKMRVMGIINYIFYALVAVATIHSHMFLLIIVFVGFFYRRLLPLSLILLSITVVLFIKALYVVGSHPKHFNPTIIIWPGIFIGAFLLWRKKQKWIVNAGLILFPLLIIFYTTVFGRFQKSGSLPATAQFGLLRTNAIKAIDPAPVNSPVRPLMFLEYPLSKTEPASIKLGTAFEVLGHYLKLILLPYPMSYYYGYSVIIPEKITAALPLLSLIIYLSLLIAALLSIRKWPLLSYGLMFYLIAISVYSNLVVPIAGMMGDRFLLVPSIGFCFLAAYLLFRVFKINPQLETLSLASLSRPFKISLAVILVLYSGLTFSRNFDWKDQLTLFNHDINAVENSAQAQNLLAVHLFIAARDASNPDKQHEILEQAVTHFKRALEIYPGFLNASFDLGRTYEALKQPDSAYEQYRITTTIDTSFVTPCFYMGVIQYNKKNYNASIPLFERFISKYPNELDAFIDLSYAYYEMKDYQQSIAIDKRAMSADPQSIVPTVNIAKVFVVMNQNDSAMYYLQLAQRMAPGDQGIAGMIETLKGMRK